MPTQVVYSHHALEDLERLDKKIARRILGKINFFITQQNPLRFAKRLTDPRYGHYRFRIGDYRVLFDLDQNGTVHILLILAIKHRREAYI